MKKMYHEIVYPIDGTLNGTALLQTIFSMFLYVAPSNFEHSVYYNNK